MIMSKSDTDMYDMADHGAVVGAVAEAEAGVATGSTREQLRVTCTTQTDLESVLDIVAQLGTLIHMAQTEFQATHEGEEGRSIRGGKKVAGGIGSKADTFNSESVISQASICSEICC